ncbi:glycosyltransferase WbsX family protein [Aquirufa sp. HETE-40SA]
MKVKKYAFYLPQFHNDPFNNKWWGDGFTEWDNVKSAKKLFVNHRQPRIPFHGYYDLMDDGETFRKQFKLAKENGIDGFIIYNYWYLGKSPLSQPLNFLLENDNLDFSYSLCWANHPWTRSWTNRMGAFDILISQEYESSLKEQEIYFEYLAKHFTDKRYIKIGNKVLYHIYLPLNIPNLVKFINNLRNYFFENHSIEIHISAIVTNGNLDSNLYYLFDSLSLSQPVNAMKDTIKKGLNKFSISTIIHNLVPIVIKKILYTIYDKFFNKCKFYDCSKLWQIVLSQYELAKEISQIPVIPYGFVDFDNTPRYKNRAKVIIGYSIEIMVDGMNNLILSSHDFDGEKLLLINAWNEWGEGMYLEEDIEFKNEKLIAISKLS